MNQTKREWKVEGPFTYRERGDDMKGYFIQGEIGGNTERTIAELGCWKDREHTLEDALLIAAAPDMYEALKQINQFVTDNPFMQSAEQQIIAGMCFVGMSKAEGKG